MPDYEEMYYTLLTAVLNTVDILNKAVVDTEDILLSSGQKEDKCKNQHKPSKRIYARCKE